MVALGMHYDIQRRGLDKPNVASFEKSQKFTKLTSKNE